MQNFKKNLGFNLALIALAGVFVALCAMAFLSFRDNKASADALARVRRAGADRSEEHTSEL